MSLKTRYERKVVMTGFMKDLIRNGRNCRIWNHI